MNARLLRLASYRGRGWREWMTAAGPWLVVSRGGRINTDDMRPLAAAIAEYEKRV